MSKTEMMQHGVYLQQNGILTALIRLFHLCLTGFSVEGPKELPTTQPWLPAFEAPAAPRLERFCEHNFDPQ